MNDTYILRPIVAEDIAYVHAGLGDPEVTRYYDVHFPTLEATKEQMEWFEKIAADGSGRWWAVVEASGRAFVGAGGYHGRDAVHRKAEIGFWLLREHWGKGIMAAAFPKLLRRGFEELDLHRIEGRVDANNEKCRHALRKTPLTYEGTLRASEYEEGKYIDIAMYAVLAHELD